MLYLYALAAELGDVADLKGVQGGPLVSLPFHDAVAIAEEVTAVPAVDATTLKAQDALVRELHDRSAALLPMRFGTTTADLQTLEKLINARLLDRLTAVRHREQMTVRVVDVASTAPTAPSAPTAPAAPNAPAAPAAPESGTDYLLARAKTREPSEAMRAIAAAAPAIVREVRVEAANRHGVHGSVYHLIERGRAAEYRAAVEAAGATIPHVRIIISGPSPAYAFA